MRAETLAVRLLTVHGAKGLEAPLVLLLDTDGESIKSQTMGVLVDWPGEATHPQRFVFLASESKPPACVADALAVEQAARRREELNALYVALTRTQRTLVVSSLQPHIANPGSWWQRLQDHAEDAPWQAQAAGGEPSESLADGDFTLLCLPNMPLALVEYAQAAIENIANPSPESTDGEDSDTLDSRIGQAMHRLLERYQPAAQMDASARLASDVQQAAIAQEFVLEPAQMAQAHAMALAIVQGEGAWAWDAAELDWQGNEVAVVQRGRMLRIDRLVRRRAAMPDEGQWWVLDYKSTRQPHHHPELCEQLLGYRNAVALAQPGQTVRAAFLTPDGTLIELSAP